MRWWFLLLILLAACAAEIEEPEAVVLADNQDLALELGEETPVKVLGYEYTLGVSELGEDSASIIVNAQTFGLHVGEEFSFGDFIIRLDSISESSASVTILENT